VLVKKIISIFLLVLTAVGIFGLPVAIKVKQARLHRSIRSQIRRGLSRNQLHTFAKTEALIEWKEKGKEFSYEGEMYDVVFTEDEDGVQVYYCLNDKEEKALNCTIGRIARSQEGSVSGNLAKGLFQILMQGFFAPWNWRMFYTAVGTRLRHPEAVPAVYTQVVRPVNEPPPRLA
jgi:hypothetical protein